MMRANFAPRVALCALLLHASTAVGVCQELPTPLFQLATGDPGPFGNPIQAADDIAMNRSLDILVSAFDGVLGSQFTALNGVVQLTSGDPLGGTGFVVRPSGEPLALGADGRPWSIVRGIDPSDPSVSERFLVSGSDLIIAPGQPCNAPSLPPGSVYETIVSIGGRGDSSCVVGGALIVGGVLRAASVRVKLDSSNAIVSEEILVMQGRPFPGFQGPIQLLFGGDFVGPGASFVVGFDPVLTFVFNETDVFRPGDPSPYPGLSWNSLESGTVGSNGDWALAGVLSDGERAIIKNGAPFIRESELPPELLAGPTGIAGLEPVHMSSRGRLVWRARQTLVSPNVNAPTYFVEYKPMAQSWRTQFGGEVCSLGALPNSFDPDGIHIGIGGGPVTFPAPSTSNFVAAFHLDQSDPACTNGESSFGMDPIVSVHGSPWLADGTDFEIMTRRLPVQAFALTLVSSSPSPGAPVTGAIGDLCLGGTIFRSPILRANGLGTTRAWLSDFPIPPALEPAVGETWRFQTWYRDVDTTSGAPVSRFTEAVEMPFL